MAKEGIGRTGSEPESNIRHISLYCRHSQQHVESVSKEISSIMTLQGYWEKMRRLRIEKYKELDRLGNARESDITVITAGSKAEGMTGCFESDIYALVVRNNILCVEAGINLPAIPYDLEVYRMDTSVYPGHCRLFLERQAPISNRTLTMLCVIMDMVTFFSIVVYCLMNIRHLCNLHIYQWWYINARAGPSLPGSVGGIFHLDKVIALRCHCPSILQKWPARARHWPPPFKVQKVEALGVYVTPVGFKGSEYKHMEWSICFNTVEAELVNNLNDTQVKVYVMLKRS